MDVMLSIIIFLGTAVFMELVAWFTHKYVMHGFLWILHQDHHQSSGRKLQKNDFFALFFATISFLLIFNGLTRGWYPMAAAGFGVACYGVGYALFHEIMFHRRIRGIRYRPQHPYLKRIFNAHRVHHRNRYKAGGPSFSFLYASKKYAHPEVWDTYNTP